MGLKGSFVTTHICENGITTLNEMIHYVIARLKVLTAVASLWYC